MKNKKDLIKILIGILTLFLYLIGSDFYQEKPSFFRALGLWSECE